MKNTLNYFIVLFLITSVSLSAQENYYKINGSQKIVNKEAYDKIKEQTKKYGRVEELLLRAENRNDSIINSVRINAVGKTPDGNYFDPYSETKEKIGTMFPIENFKNEKGVNLNKSYLQEKPTFINFWFTKCPPCIDEIPLLNKLKEKFGDKVNFLTISFNDRKTIDEFLKSTDFKFEHITDSKKQIDELNISAYPTNLILDKEGIIKFVFGEVTYDLQDLETILDGLTS